MAQENPLLIVFCTVPDQAAAKTLSGSLLEEKLAACVSAMPGVVSRYRWQGKLETEEEVQLLIKTTAAQWSALEPWLRAQHPYDNPEIIALPAAKVSDQYQQWVQQACGGAGE